MQALNLLFEGLKKAGIEDQVTFANFGVFGRTFKISGNGRNHNLNHHVMMITGAKIKSSVIGGLEEVIPFR